MMATNVATNEASVRLKWLFEVIDRQTGTNVSDPEYIIPSRFLASNYGVGDLGGWSNRKSRRAAAAKARRTRKT